MKSVEFLAEAEQNVAKKKIDQQLDQLSNQEIDALLSMIDKSLDEGRFDTKSLYNKSEEPKTSQPQKQTSQPQVPRPQPEPQPKAVDPEKQKIDRNISSVINKLDNQDKKILQAALQDEKTEREINNQNSDSENKIEPKSATQVSGIVNNIIEFFKKQLNINDLKPEEVAYPVRFQNLADFAKDLSTIKLTLSYLGKRDGEVDIKIDYDESNPGDLSTFIEEAKLLNQQINLVKYDFQQYKKDKREEYSFSVANRSSTAGWGILGRGWRSPGGIAANIGRMGQRTARQLERQSYLNKIAGADKIIQELEGVQNFLKKNELVAKKKLSVMKNFRRK